METARTNNRMGNPVGSSYLSEASSLMQRSILPDAQLLYEETSARVDAETSTATRIPAPVIIVLTATVCFGAFAHRWLARHTRRRINIGLIAGGLAILLMIFWVGTALTISTAGSRSAKNTAAASLRSVQSRDHRTAGPCRRNPVADSPRRRGHPQTVLRTARPGHARTTGPLPGAQGRHRQNDLADADQLLTNWLKADQRINAYTAVGDYRAATAVALGTRDDDSTPAFDKLDSALSEGIRENRNQLRNDIFSAQRVLSGTTVGGWSYPMGRRSRWRWASGHG